MSHAVAEMFSKISAKYDLANDLLSLGIHRKWRKQLRKSAQLAKSRTVLDICTGTGDLAKTLKQDFSGAVVGLDFVSPMLKVAKKKIGDEISLVQGDALTLPIKSDTIGISTIAFGIRNLDDPIHGLTEIRRVLNSDGQLLVLEFGQPTVPVIKQFYKFYSSFVIPLVGGFLTGDKNAYKYLPETSARFPSGDQFLKLMNEAGFKRCKYTPLSFGIAYLYEGYK